MGRIGRETVVGNDSSIVRFLHGLYATTRVEQAWELHVLKMAEYGFDRVLYSNACLPNGVGVLEDTLILTNHPRSFLDPFLQSGLWRRGVYVRRAEAQGLRAHPWRMPEARPPSPEERQVLEFRAAHGVVAGYSLSFHGLGTPGRAGMALYARRDLRQDEVDAIWARHGQQIEVMCIAFHLRVSTLPVDLPGRTLTARQREVLRWASDGKTVHEIARQMGLTAPTVEKHMRLARAALGVPTTTMAVLKASFLNQLFRVGAPQALEPVSDAVGA